MINWTFNDILIADISGDQSQICANVQCKERFTNRLELDQQTGSLIITNTRSTDAGVYKLQLIRSRIKVRRRRSISVISVWSFSVSVIGKLNKTKDLPLRNSKVQYKYSIIKCGNNVSLYLSLQIQAGLMVLQQGFLLQ